MVVEQLEAPLRGLPEPLLEARRLQAHWLVLPQVPESVLPQVQGLVRVRVRVAVVTDRSGRGSMSDRFHCNEIRCNRGSLLVYLDKCSRRPHCFPDRARIALCCSRYVWNLVHYPVTRLYRRKFAALFFDRQVFARSLTGARDRSSNRNNIDPQQRKSRSMVWRWSDQG